MKFSITTFTATIGTETRETIIALRGDEIVGQLFLKCDRRRVAQFSWLVVKDRAAGVGSALLKYAEGFATAAHCESIGCTIDPGNHDVVDWYKKHGYILAGEFDDDTLIMAKAL